MTEAKTDKVPVYFLTEAQRRRLDIRIDHNPYNMSPEYPQAFAVVYMMRKFIEDELAAGRLTPEQLNQMLKEADEHVERLRKHSL